MTDNALEPLKGRFNQLIKDFEEARRALHADLRRHGLDPAQVLRFDTGGGVIVENPPSARLLAMKLRKIQKELNSVKAECELLRQLATAQERVANDVPAWERQVAEMVAAGKKSEETASLRYKIIQARLQVPALERKLAKLRGLLNEQIIVSHTRKESEL
jgi:hypothetical protein